MNRLTTITLLEKGKNKILLQPIRLAVHQPCSIMEAVSPANELYHVYFYKQQFLAAKKVTRSRRSSYLEQAFTKGIVFLCPHPAATLLLVNHEHVKNRSLTDLLQYVKKRFSPLEIAQIFRCFDSLIQPDKLFKVMRESYYEYRREGKWGKAYSVLLTLEEAFPSHEWVTHTKRDPSFSSYHKIYQSMDQTLLKKDPSTMEWLLWKNRSHAPYRSLWFNTFGSQSSHTIAVFSLLYEQQLTNDTSLATHFLETANHLFTQTELTQILLQLASDPSASASILRQAFRQAVKLHAWDDAMKTFIDHPFPLELQDIKCLTEAIPHVKWDNPQLPLEKLSRTLVPVLKNQKKDLDMILTACIPILSRSHDLHDLLHWLKPLNDHQCKLPVQQTLQQLSHYAEDPDKQFQAGELYYKLGLKKEAIDSFNWEIELHPDDPSPVRRLCSLYHELGQTDEAAVYQQLLKSM
ncbi:tetratricopeptide repeat protein [Jeotgalibacillus soli]|uniref:Uncharacterized protein n=1 Tax=Jeotgalibacillus soli TaxID=889306 RepID=A0A0C2VZ31_9BACL|nr:hypothetical protein [Jeotgalibacillus soli]KIL49646.1 hypothetical protein KP78_11140 [Jeotgalibacillus soli]